MNKYVLKSMIEKTIAKVTQRRRELERERKFQTINIEVKEIYYKIYDYLMQCYYELLKDINSCKETIYQYGYVYDKMEMVEDVYVDYLDLVTELYL
ncbi:MAG: hypothetical protein J6J36_00460 [Clostridia bacterium]|nr:hypothetical protein [Clostridia bacterium]